MLFSHSHYEVRPDGRVYKNICWMKASEKIFPEKILFWTFRK